MKRHYYIIGTMVLLGVLGAVLILVTTPGKSTSSQNALATATPDQSTRLNGANIEGQLVFSRQGQLWTWKGGNATRLKIEPGNSVVANNTVKLIQPVFSNDGSRLAFVRQDETFSDLWVANADGSGARPLTTNKGSGTPRSPGFTESALWAYFPAWSPDGTEIAFLSDIGTDDLELWTTNASRATRRSISKLAAGQGGLQRPGWSPQGDALAVAGFENGKSQIYTVKAANGTATRLTDLPEGAYDPAWSPDGRSIAYVARRGNSSELWLMRPDGSGAALLTGQNARSPVWSPDGKKLAFLSLKDGVFEIYIQELAAGGISPQGGPAQLSNGAKLDGNGGLAWSR